MDDTADETVSVLDISALGRLMVGEMLDWGFWGIHVCLWIERVGGSEGW